MTSWHIYEYFLDIIFSWKKKTLNIEHNGLADIPRKQDGTLSKRECQPTGISVRIHATGQFVRGCDPLERHRRKHPRPHCEFLSYSEVRGVYLQRPYATSHFIKCACLISNVSYFFHSTLKTLGMPLFCSNIISCQPILPISPNEFVNSPKSTQSHSNDFLRRYFAILSVEPNKNTRIPSSQR